MDSTLGLFCVLKCETNLVSKLRTFISFQGFKRLVEIVLDKIEEGAVILFRDTRVLNEERTISDQGVCSL